MAKDIKAPEDYKTVKFNVYLFPRDAKTGHVAARIDCINTKVFNIRTRTLGQMLDAMTVEYTKASTAIAASTTPKDLKAIMTDFLKALDTHDARVKAKVKPVVKKVTKPVYSFTAKPIAKPIAKPAAPVAKAADTIKPSI